MTEFIRMNVSIVGSRKSILRLTVNQMSLSFWTSLQGWSDSFIELRWTGDVRMERFRDFEKLLLYKWLRAMQVGQKFSRILNVTSNKGSIRISFNNFLSCLLKSSYWISQAKMIILKRTSKHNVSLNYLKFTCPERLAVTSINFVLDVTDWK